jgi:hypothetical protein
MCVKLSILPCNHGLAAAARAAADLVTKVRHHGDAFSLVGLRRSFATQMYAITSISTSEFPGMPPAAAMVVRTGGSAPKRPWNTSFMPA